MGCPNPALTCFLVVPGVTLCDCPGPPPGGKNGDPCAFYSDCQAGYVCIGVGGGGGNQCRAVCSKASPACPVGQTCNVSGGDPGFCN
jgi:hypothetical protein